ncbi:CHAT domain-containing protein [Ferruginibacter paludis]|uniref:CHAT domain-containing protein n=1 Tax=Ferruginibacter paludis TaxID=1310417 RepID=UPI0025B4D40A|nr:CHAT domain-containing protein [Ferruginibacter paludis]MDN3655506.1 CHAT domain-containing protein [Ferruginibacter paludis]
MRILTSILIIIAATGVVAGQCPDKNFLWRRIVILKDSTNIDPKKQLDELLGYSTKLNQCGSIIDSGYVLLLHRIGWLHATQKDYFSAILSTQNAIKLISGNIANEAINPRQIIKSYWNLHIFYDSLKLESKKMAAIDSCIANAIKLNGEFDIALNALTIKVRQLFNNGDYYSCIYFTDLGESIIAKNKKTVIYAEYFESRAFTWKINSLIFLNKYDDAEELVNRKIEVYERQKNTAMLATLYGLVGQIKRHKGDFEKAIYFFRKSFEFNKKNNYSQGCAEALNNIGFAYYTDLHLNTKAITYHFKALSYADANESLNIFDNIANIYTHTGRYDSGFFYFQKAFDQLRPGFNEADLLKKENAELAGTITEYITGMVLDKASACLLKYKTTGDKKFLAEAIRIYDITDQYFEQLKATQSEVQSRLFWRTNNRRLYEQAIEACYASSNSEKAFHFFEKSRSVLLNDQLRQQYQMSDRDISRQAQLKKNILDIENDLQKLQAIHRQSAELQQQLYANKQELNLLNKQSEAILPSFDKKNFDTAAPTLGQVRNKILTSNKILLEIFAGDSNVYIMAADFQKIYLVQLDKQLYDSLTSLYIKLISGSHSLNNNFTLFTTISNELYKLIFKNLLLSTAESLIISPDGKSFPFEALVTGFKNGQPDYLLHRYATSYTYSAKYLMNDYLPNTENSYTVLGMAPITYKADTGLNELNGSDISLQKIKELFPNTTNLLFEKASKKNFFEQFPSYTIIQLYTHASDSSSGNDPIIYFADSSMLLSELITDRKPITQLVVLSACETANGKLYEGEGIFSFNRGFAALGIPAAVSTLWSVENESTYKITELFYKYLAQELPTDIALQKAKLEFISTSTSKEKTLPYYWAGPILTGKVDTIIIKKTTPWKTILIAGIALLAGAFTTKKYLLNKRNRG